MVLESLEHAQNRGATILAELVGYGATSDGYDMVQPSGEGAARCMRQAMQGLERPIQYINAHGTSTSLNDKYETFAIKTAFGDRAKKIPISSNKSMIGHLLGASGAVEFIGTILSMQNSVIPPTINQETPDPECDLDYVPNQARPQNINIAMSNSFGFGGHNAILIIKKFI